MDLLISSLSNNMLSTPLVSLTSTTFDILTGTSINSQVVGTDGLTSTTLDILTGTSINSQVVGTNESLININSNGSYNKTIITGDGNDYINAGMGNDTITSGAGSDIFAFGSPLEGVDTITDFSIEQGDKIQISAAGFGIGANDFGRFAYDAATGGLYFDNTQLATLPLNLPFDRTTNITIV
jgi:serralysin